MRLTLDSNVHLEKHQAIGRHDVEISKSRVAKAAAEAEALPVQEISLRTRPCPH